MGYIHIKSVEQSHKQKQLKNVRNHLFKEEYLVVLVHIIYVYTGLYSTGDKT